MPKDKGYETNLPEYIAFLKAKIRQIQARLKEGKVKLGTGTLEDTKEKTVKRKLKMGRQLK